MFHILGFQVIFRRIKAIRFMMVDKNVPIRKKLIVVFGLVYLFSPIDLIPILIFPIALLDDIILWTCILLYLKDTLDSYWMGDKEEDFSQKFKKNKIVDDVEFTVEDEDRKE